MVEVGWLRSLGADGLARLLERRPEGCREPVPLALSELAERLVEPAAVLAALRRLERPAVQVVEVLAALGGVDVDRAEVARLLARRGRWTWIGSSLTWLIWACSRAAPC